jgi:hypothetical protein
MLETLKNSLFADLGSFAISKVKSATQPKRKIPAYMTEEISDVDLLKQTRENVKFIESKIRSLRPLATTAKGSSAGETRKKRRNIKESIEWYEGKLKEEKGMIKYYEQKIQ